MFFENFQKFLTIEKIATMSAFWSNINILSSSFFIVLIRGANCEGSWEEVAQ